MLGDYSAELKVRHLEAQLEFANARLAEAEKHIKDAQEVLGAVGYLRDVLNKHLTPPKEATGASD